MLALPFPWPLLLPSDEAEQVWVWEYETDEGAHDLYMDQGEEIRFRVTDEIFVDTSPTGPAQAATDAPGTEDAGQKKESPYTLVVSKYTDYIYCYMSFSRFYPKRYAKKCI